MSCLMNYREDELGELQSPLLESRARLERQQIGGLHDRRGEGPRGGWGWGGVRLPAASRPPAWRAGQCGPGPAFHWSARLLTLPSGGKTLSAGPRRAPAAPAAQAV